ncbi:HAD family acid phosphatase [Horticoccus sp. 23ND18S-11]|uniref:HAD family acid phosphatase n=1 Tax=Horticoccus sp. 23ND18S-11 TaxID=3391832 RepID=UPI0039C8E140
MFFHLLALTLGLLVAGCATSTSEPRNLTELKREVRAYVEDGRYRRDIDVVATRARVWVEERASRGGTRLAIVFDLDETLLYNWPQISARDFGYEPKEWDKWLAEARAPAIESVREVYRTARARGVDVIFLTGRPETSRAATDRNLRAIECGDYSLLICKPEGRAGTAAEYKTAERKKLSDQGRVIIANIGDQASDLSGGFAERVFKLPNAFYLID